jgi:DAK2 domain fusion protein YloV
VWLALTAWLRRARTIITESAPALDAMNVFPVSDSDTGSNLELTLTGIADALPEVDPAEPGRQDELPASADRFDSLVQAAILSAHGNSGAIVAEMFISIFRALQHDHVELLSLQRGELISRLIKTASAAADRAVARPIDGTILTVANAAAGAAEAKVAEAADALAVARATQVAARTALARTPEQLPILADAGVVDAGGQALVLLIDVLVEVLGGEQASPLRLPESPPSRPAPQVPESNVEYEVMYALQGATPGQLDRLRQQLSDLGNSVVVVGDSAVAQVHAHLLEAGAAIEAGLGLGRLSRIQVTALDRAASADGRTIIAAVSGEGLAEAVRTMGGVPISAIEQTELLQKLGAAVQQADRDVVVLPNGMVSVQSAASLAGEVGHTRRVAVIPTAAQIQGLAALAVHEPTADFDSTVVAMSTAAAHARHAGVMIAESPKTTTAGLCRRGDVLGIVDGDVVEIGDSVVEVGWRVTSRLLAAGGELLTLVNGADAEPKLADELSARARHAMDGLDVEVLHGGQRPYVLLIGLE